MCSILLHLCSLLPLQLYLSLVKPSYYSSNAKSLAFLVHTHTHTHTEREREREREREGGREREREI